MAEKKKTYFNPKTGQQTTDPIVAKNTGAVEDTRPQSSGKTFRIGNQVVSQEEYKTEKAGNKIIQQGGRKVTPNLTPEILNEQIDKTSLGLQENNAVDLPPVVQQPELSAQKIPTNETQPPQEYAPDGTPLYSGSVSPITANDLTDVVSLFAGGGLITAGSKGVSKLAGKEAVEKVGGILGREGTEKVVEVSVKKGTKKIAAKKATELATKIKGFRKKLFSFGGGALATVGALNFIGIDAFRGKVDGYQQAFNTLGQTATDWTQRVKDGRLTPEDGISYIQEIESELDYFEDQLQLAKISNTRAKNNGDMLDVVTDLYEKKLLLQDAKSQMRSLALQQNYPQVDAQVLNQWLSSAEEDEINEINAEYQAQLNKLEKNYGNR